MSASLFQTDAEGKLGEKALELRGNTPGCARVKLLTPFFRSRGEAPLFPLSRVCSRKILVDENLARLDIAIDRQLRNVCGNTDESSFSFPFRAFLSA